MRAQEKRQAPKSRSATTTLVRSQSVTTTLVRSQTVTNDLPGYDSARGGRSVWFGLTSETRMGSKLQPVQFSLSEFRGPRRQQQPAAPSSSNRHQPFTAAHSSSASTPRPQLRFTAAHSRPTQPSIVSICRRCSCSDLRDQGLSCLADSQAEFRILTNGSPDFRQNLSELKAEFRILTNGNPVVGQ
ncbi:hypothetical protein WN943_006257 [Citrus x changshan-huyou]